MMSFTPFGLLGISVLITLVVGLITTQLYINLCIQDNSWSNSKVIYLINVLVALFHFARYDFVSPIFGESELGELS